MEIVLSTEFYEKGNGGMYNRWADDKWRLEFSFVSSKKNVKLFLDVIKTKLVEIEE